MALIKCPECGKEVSDKAPACIHCGCPLPINKYPAESQTQIVEQEVAESQNTPATTVEKPKSKKGKYITLTIIFVAILSVVVYKTFIVRTVDSGNGWKHQIGHFGDCDFNDLSSCEEATHRVYGSFVTAGVYCDEHWDEYGQDYYERLAEKSSSGNSSSESTNAKICAQKAVEDNLKSPSTAKFCSYSEMTATNLGDNRWKVTGYVDAQNSFGATIREEWTVTLTLTNSGFKDYNVDFS